jgi:hypothetical protein
MRVTVLKAALAALLFAGLLPFARAEVWGFVDDKGVAHFAPEKMDERYELFFRGGESFDTSSGVPTPRAVAVPTVAHKLIAFFEISPSYKQVKHHLRAASKTHGVDYELLKALIATESGFDPRAVSPKGAVGLMQVMPATAERYGVTGDKKMAVSKKLTDPRTNIKTGARYLRYVQRAGNRVPNFRETQNYVKTVMQLYAMLKPPAMTAPGLNGHLPGRVRVVLPGMPIDRVYTPAMTMGGAAKRANLPSRPSEPSRPSMPSALSPVEAAAQSDSPIQRE